MALTEQEKQAQLQSIAEQIKKIQSQVQTTLAPGVQALTQAQTAGMAITPQTTVQQAQQYTGSPGTTTPIAPTTTPTTSTPTVPTLTSGSDLQAILNALGQKTQAQTDYEKMLAGLQTQQQSYLDYLKGQQTPLDIFTQYREQLGLPAKEEQLAGIQSQVQQTQTLLENLEKDINERIQGKMITDPLRRRQLAVEGTPLREQLSKLVSSQGIAQTGMETAQQQLANMVAMAQQTQQQQAQIAGMPAEFTSQLLPAYQSMAGQATPHQDLLNMLMQAEVQQQYQTPEKPATTGDITEYEYAKKNGYTGTFEQWLIQKSISGGGTPDKPLTASDSAIRNWILENKRNNPDMPYYDLWGELAEEMKKQGLNPSNYDKIFWEILHPEGEAGYTKYVKGGGGGEELVNPFIK